MKLTEKVNFVALFLCVWAFSIYHVPTNWDFRIYMSKNNICED
ncbi:hypothetical protein ACUW9N_001258 [Staphylococcus auricularis]|nr:Uncharacterised protein [Staphylococcus auricularis]